MTRLERPRASSLGALTTLSVALAAGLATRGPAVRHATESCSDYQHLLTQCQPFKISGGVAC